MNKVLILLTSIFFQAMTSFYDISFEALDGSQVNMASFHNKRVVIMEFNASSPDMGLLQHLDSLQSANAALQVIVVPARDFADSLNKPFLDSLDITLDPRLIVTSPSYVKDSSGSKQHPLFDWLTDADQNQHFDYDATTQNQIFVVSEKGTLFAVIQKESTSAPLDDAINRFVNQ